MNDGGPAFPTDAGHEYRIMGHPGMTLRDWFAGQALTDMKVPWFISEAEAADVARGAYRVADAMLAGRDK